jgi:hypothetical protein
MVKIGEKAKTKLNELKSHFLKLNSENKDVRHITSYQKITEDAIDLLHHNSLKK